MLDVSLGELAIIMVVAVLVIGPKELPTVIAHVTRWIRKIRAFSQQITSQFMSLEEMDEIHKLRQELREQASYIRDAEGKLYRTYDISDIMPSSQTVIPEAANSEAVPPQTEPAIRNPEMDKASGMTGLVGEYKND